MGVRDSVSILKKIIPWLFELNFETYEIQFIAYSKFKVSREGRKCVLTVFVGCLLLWYMP